MLSAYLVFKATEAEKSRRETPSGGGEGQPGGAAAATAAASTGAGAASGTAAAGEGGGAGEGLAPAAACADDGGVGGFAGGGGGSVGDGGSGSGGGGGCCLTAGAVERTDSLENLAAFVAEGEGGRWRTDWHEEDRAAFRRGIFAFRRDFHRVRAAFLPHKKYGDVVEYFYR